MTDGRRYTHGAIRLKDKSRRGKCGFVDVCREIIELTNFKG